jgi:hypothetical protein
LFIFITSLSPFIRLYLCVFTIFTPNVVCAKVCFGALDLPGGVGGCATVDTDHVALKEKLALKNKLLRNSQLTGKLPPKDMDINSSSNNNNNNSSSDSYTSISPSGGFNSSKHNDDPLLQLDSALPLSVIPHGTPLDRNFPSSFLSPVPSDTADLLSPAVLDEQKKAKRPMMSPQPSAESAGDRDQSAEDSVQSEEDGSGLGDDNDVEGGHDYGQGEDFDRQSAEYEVNSSEEDFPTAEEAPSAEAVPPAMMMMVPELRPIPPEQLLSIPATVRRTILQQSLERTAAQQPLEEVVRAELAAQEQEEDR